MAFDDTSAARSPAPVDVHVGVRIRMRRKMLGMSQETLAESLGLTFQQVQKYERGANRVSASKLYDIAKTLQTPVSYFFDGLADPVDPGAEPVAENPCLMLASLPYGAELATALQSIDSRMRASLLGLVTQMVLDRPRDPV
jgi:transcriptional regulator with XRE-family HTH domain